MPATVLVPLRPDPVTTTRRTGVSAGDSGTVFLANIGANVAPTIAVADARPGRRRAAPAQGSIRFPSASQCASTFLLGCTRGGSPGIFG